MAAAHGGRSILAVFALVRDFGYNEKSLTSKNTLLPIIYWVHHKGLADGIISKVALHDDRDRMRRWLHVMLLKGIFGASADTVLAAIRKAFMQECIRGMSQKHGLPLRNFRLKSRSGLLTNVPAAETPRDPRHRPARVVAARNALRERSGEHANRFKPLKRYGFLHRLPVNPPTHIFPGPETDSSAISK